MKYPVWMLWTETPSSARAFTSEPALQPVTFLYDSFLGVWANKFAELRERLKLEWVAWIFMTKDHWRGKIAHSKFPKSAKRSLCTFCSVLGFPLLKAGTISSAASHSWQSSLRTGSLKFMYYTSGAQLARLKFPTQKGTWEQAWIVSLWSNINPPRTKYKFVSPALPTSTYKDVIIFTRVSYGEMSVRVEKERKPVKVEYLDQITHFTLPMCDWVYLPTGLGLQHHFWVCL